MDINSDIKGIESVSFLPWVGKNYESGIKGYNEDGVIYGTKDDPGKRILVLGESHYCADPNDATEDLTKKIINDFVYSESEHEPYKNTYIKFERALAGRVIDEEERKKLWSHLMFYNYVQVPITGPRMSPSGFDYINSEAPFFDVITIYKPDIVITWGQRLYSNLPPNLYEYRGAEYIDISTDILPNIQTWYYELSENKKVAVLCINHPSSGFSWPNWFKIIFDFINI